MILLAPFVVGISTHIATIGTIDLFAQALYALTLFMLAVLADRLRFLGRCCPFWLSFDGWDLATWFAWPNLWMGDARPVDLIDESWQACWAQPAPTDFSRPVESSGDSRTRRPSASQQGVGRLKV